MVIFHSYVSLPEGKMVIHDLEDLGVPPWRSLHVLADHVVDDDEASPLFQKILLQGDVPKGQKYRSVRFS